MEFVNLFTLSFLAGSFVPVGSEVYFLYLQTQGQTLWQILVVASIGNTLGGMTCYYIARKGRIPLLRKYFKHTEQELEKWQKKLKGKAEVGALLCWLPLVGEIIASAIGLLSDKALRVLIFMFIGKFGRYLLISMAGSLL